MLDKEILVEFRAESNQLLDELTAVVEKLERPSAQFPSQLLEEFSQKIDRMMGTVKTIAVEDPDHVGFQRIATITEICKKLGYKAVESRNNILVPVFAGFWADTIEVLQDLLNAAEDPAKTEQIAQSFTPILIGRLEWLSKKLTGKGLPPASAETKEKAALGNLDVDDLLKQFGL